MKVGFIGLGNMGEPAAFLLLNKGYSLTVHDLDRARGDRLVEAGAIWGESPAAVAAACDSIVTSLPGPPEVRAVVEGPNGIFEGAIAGAVWIDMSTSDRGQMRALAERLAEREVKVLEATATGGVQNAWAGHVTLFVGGEPAVFEAQQPLLEAIADRIFYMGPLGAATVTKLITNMMCFVNQTALAEGLMLGARAGLELGALLEAILASYAGSFVAEVDGPQILDGSYDRSFNIGLVVKDATLGMALAREVGAPMEVTALVADIMARAKDRYGERAGALKQAKLLEDDTGVSLRAPWPKA